jgi:hypothetical protein
VFSDSKLICAPNSPRTVKHTLFLIILLALHFLQSLSGGFLCQNTVRPIASSQNLFRPVMYVVPLTSMRIASTVTGTGFLGRV